MLFLFSAQLASAAVTCTLNGEEIPCDQMPWWTRLFFLIPILFIVGGIFWLWMLMDVIKRQQEDRLMWVLILIFLAILGAIIYYFVIKRKRVAVKNFQ